MIQEFIQHLQAVVTPTVEYAYTANPVEDIDILDPKLPAIFVYPGDYSAELSEIDNLVRQPIRENVACLLICRIADYETLRDELRAAALGWTFQQYDAFELLSGEVLDLSGGLIFVRETYTTQHIITET